jgi:repressor LexA
MLTDRQRQVLRFICRSLVERQRPPTLREICAELGTASTNGATDHLNALEKKGFISRGDRYDSRAIVILHDEDGRLPVVEFRVGGAS